MPSANRGTQHQEEESLPSKLENTKEDRNLTENQSDVNRLVKVIEDSDDHHEYENSILASPIKVDTITTTTNCEKRKPGQSSSPPATCQSPFSPPLASPQ